MENWPESKVYLSTKNLAENGYMVWTSLMHFWPSGVFFSFMPETPVKASEGDITRLLNGTLHRALTTPPIGNDDTLKRANESRAAKRQTK